MEEIRKISTMKLRAEAAVRLLQRPGGPEIRLKLLHLLLLMLDLGNCASELSSSQWFWQHNSLRISRAIRLWQNLNLQE